MGSWTLQRQVLFFFFNDTATTEIYTLSLHDALPICAAVPTHGQCQGRGDCRCNRPRHPMRSARVRPHPSSDRKSTRLNSSHANISYAVFCLKKKNNLLLYSFSAIIIFPR